VLAICREVAEADGVVVDSEDAMVARIEGALGL
jgi:tellurite resistance protein